MFSSGAPPAGALAALLPIASPADTSGQICDTGALALRRLLLQRSSGTLRRLQQQATKGEKSGSDREKEALTPHPHTCSSNLIASS